MKKSMVSICLGVMIVCGLTALSGLALAAKTQEISLIQDVQADFCLASGEAMSTTGKTTECVAQAQQEKKPEEMKQKPAEPEKKKEDVDKEKKEKDEEEEPSLKPSKC